MIEAITKLLGMHRKPIEDKTKIFFCPIIITYLKANSNN